MSTRWVLALATALGLSLVGVTASADSTTASPVAVTNQTPGVVVLPTITVIGRPNMPSVVIFVKRASPVVEAAAAHAVLHEATLRQSIPPGLRQ